MPVLSIALQEGFSDDVVVVSVNDQEVLNQASVSTRHQIGIAYAFEVDVAEGFVVIEVALPNKNVSESIELDVVAPVYLGVSLSHEGEISCRISQEPFGYA